jgi:choline-sulfatase
MEGCIVNRQRLWGVMLLSAVAMYLWTGSDVKKHGSSRDSGPNVMLITLDTTRLDAIGAYGGGNLTPNIDRLAQEGARFTQAISTAPITQPAHLGILTGEPPYRSGVVTNGTEIGDRPGILARRLQSEGWVTAGFVSAYPLTGRFGWGQGFDHFDDQLKVGLLGSGRERAGRLTVDRALAWLKVHRKERWAVWVHLFDPHGPYEAPGRPIDGSTVGEALDVPAYWPDEHKAITDLEWFAEAYRAEVREADAQVGRIVAALEAEGTLDDTLVVVTADHGESLTEHGYLFDHGDHLYDASLRVPWLVRWPAAVGAGETIDCSVSTASVAPTIVGLLGLADDTPPWAADLAAVLRGQTSCTDVEVLSSTVTEKFRDPPPIAHALRSPTGKHLRPAVGQDICFDLLADPNENDPLSVCDAATALRLDESLVGRVPVRPPQDDAETQKALEELGYIEP